eukprot:TRINITY_DN7406_c0_g1_i3.p1 TRINITY_DN7406_c0_g1~~TRINITY_DN7406_c0_g1_i3.p1  ORF type:complete len:177 (-),score=14.83 TRINITY_DN7406_c0_g1_i3:298-828(-)
MSIPLKANLGGKPSVLRLNQQALRHRCSTHPSQLHCLHDQDQDQPILSSLLYSHGWILRNEVSPLSPAYHPETIFVNQLLANTDYSIKFWDVNQTGQQGSNLTIFKRGAQWGVNYSVFNTSNTTSLATVPFYLMIKEDDHKFPTATRSAKAWLLPSTRVHDITLTCTYVQSTYPTD